MDLSASISGLDADYCFLAADETIVGNNTDGAVGTLQYYQYQLMQLCLRII